MGFIQDYSDIAYSVIVSPSKTLRDEERTNPFGFPLKFAFTSLLIAGIFRTAIAWFSASTSIFPIAKSFLLTSVGGLLGLALTAGVIHIFVYLLGGRNGYGKTLSAVFYGSAVAPLANLLLLGGVFVSILGLLGLIIGLWALQIEYRGIQHFQEMNETRAGLSIIIPILLAFGAMLATTFYYVSMIPTL